jgi:hypothetical protein
MDNFGRASWRVDDFAVWTMVQSQAFSLLESASPDQSP